MLRRLSVRGCLGTRLSEIATSAGPWGTMGRANLKLFLSSLAAPFTQFPFFVPNPFSRLFFYEGVALEERVTGERQEPTGTMPLNASGIELQAAV